jgi:hypothetical protein
MAGQRQPGVTGVVANASPIDDGTLARTSSSSPGTVGAASKQDLSGDDLEFIRTTAGRGMTLQKLQHSRELHIQEREAAERQAGPGSWRALFEQATVDHLSKLIDEAQSPRGRAAKQVRLLTQELRKSGRVDSEERLSAAIGTLLSLERERDSNDSSESMALLADALNAAAERRSAVLKNLIQKVERGTSVSDEELRGAMSDVLSVERQRQLLGVSETDSGPNPMALMADTLNSVAGRKKTALKSLIEKVKRAGTCTPAMQEQLLTAETALLSLERQRQLLGASQTASDGADTMALVKEAQSLR